MATKNLGELDIQGDLLLAGSYGTAGQVLQSNGTGVTPSWVTPNGAVNMASGYYYGPAGSQAGATMTLNRMTLVPLYVPLSTTFTRIAAYTSTSVAGSTARLGIYTSTSGGLPNALVIEAGSISGSGTGSKSITISQTLSAGLYWLACAGQSTAPAFRSLNAATQYVAQGTVSVGLDSNPMSGFYVDSISGALPSTVSTYNRATSAVVVYLGV